MKTDQESRTLLQPWFFDRWVSQRSTCTRIYLEI